MNVHGIIFANIYDSSLGMLTNKRTMASLPFGGRYRQVDFALSNMSNAGIRHISVIARYNYQSLMAHIGSGEEWDLEFQDDGLEYLNPYSLGQTEMNRGKLQALYSVRNHLEQRYPDDFVVLADSTVLYNIDLEKVLEDHIASGKDITVLCKAGVANGKKLLDLAIKMEDEITDMALDYVAPEGYLASMGLFVISKALLMHHVRESVARGLYHFERDFLARQFRAGNLSVNVHTFDGVVLYNESTEEYYDSNLQVLNPEVRRSLFNEKHPIYTKVRDRVPCYYGENCNVDNSIIADGCAIEGSVKDSVLFRDVIVGENAQIEGCLIMNNAVVGEGARLKCVIMDKDVVVRPGAELIGTPSNPVCIQRGDTV